MHYPVPLPLPGQYTRAQSSYRSRYVYDAESGSVKQFKNESCRCEGTASSRRAVEGIIRTYQLRPLVQLFNPFLKEYMV